MTYPGGTPNRSMGAIVGYTPELPAGFGGYAVRFHVESAQGVMTDLTGATWADWDRHGRLVLTIEGRLLASESTREAPRNFRVLADFNPLRPDPQPSPAWARAWPRSSRRAK